MNLRKEPLPPIESGHPIPPPQPPRKTPPVPPNPWIAHLKGCDHGDSFVVPYTQSNDVRRLAKSLGLVARYKSIGWGIAPGYEGNRLRHRVWILRPPAYCPEHGEVRPHQAASGPCCPQCGKSLYPDPACKGEKLIRI